MLGRLKPTDKDPRDRRYLTPVQIVRTTGNVRDAEQLLQPTVSQVALTCEREITLRNDTKGTHASVLLDFGMEIQGSVRIQVFTVRHSGQDEDWGNNLAQVRVRFGESVSETLAEYREKNTTNNHAPRDMVLCLPNYSAPETSETGFRFVHLELLSPDTVLTLAGVQGVLIFRDLAWQGHFECSDPLLNRIYDTAVWTVQLNMQEYLWDGIKRDRLVWAGDMGTEIRTIAAVFGNQRIVPESLERVLRQTPQGKWINGLSSYALWWFMEVYDWFMATGDREWLESQRESLLSQIRLIRTCVTEDGRENLTGRRYLDWPSSENPDAMHAGLQGLMILAVQSAEKLFDFLGEEAAARDCRETEALLRRHVPALSGYKQADALLALSGLRDAGEVAEMLTRGGAAGFSSFLSCFTLGALAEGNRIREALDCIRAYWGGMLKMGATSFWEDFDIRWMENAFPIDQLPEPGKKDVHGDFGRACYVGFRHSLCHGWAASPVPFLTEHVAGIRVLDPGFSRVSIAPRLGDLSWIRCTCPTPCGALSVEAQSRPDGEPEVRVRAPEGITVTP